MNPSPSPDSESLRSDIDVTRRRMDDTLDALNARMQPHHLLDEVLGCFRHSDSQGNSRFSTMSDQLSQRTNTAVHAVVDTVKSNPIPALLIAGGVAWMIYNTRRHASRGASGPTTADSGRYDPDAHVDRPLEYPSPAAGDSESKLGRLKEGIGEAATSAREKLAHARQAAGEKWSAARERAGEMGARVRQRSGEIYSATRERIVTTADQHPLETGLACLAAGVIAGLALPTPGPIARRLGPAADRPRDRDSGRATGRSAAQPSPVSGPPRPSTGPVAPETTPAIGAACHPAAARSGL